MISDKTLDLADLVQAFRSLKWSTYLRDDVTGECQSAVGDAWYKSLETLLVTAAALDADHPDIAAKWRFLAAAFAAIPPPRRPSTEELLTRFRRGEIGDRTVRYIEGWDPWEFFEACQKHRVPPMQGEGDD